MVSSDRRRITYSDPGKYVFLIFLPLGATHFHFSMVCVVHDPLFAKSPGPCPCVTLAVICMRHKLVTPSPFLKTLFTWLYLTYLLTPFLDAW